MPHPLPINGLAIKNRAAVNESDRPVSLLVEAYVDLISGWWEHDFAGKDKTVWQAVECVANYEEQRDQIIAQQEAQRDRETARPLRDPS